MNRALIFGGGVYDDVFPEILEDDYIIAADKGNELLRARGIAPHVTIGDFDSSSEIPEDNAIVLPVEKDVTDSYAAAELALEKGIGEIVIYGGMGGRPDHSLANYALIVSLTQRAVRASLVGEGYRVTAVCNGKIKLSGEKGKTVSVFSYTDKAEGVTLRGLHYPLEDAMLTSSFALGVSNSFEEDTAEISVKNGILLIMQQI